ncbi:MAG: sulfite exporter TauE/SafE family protein, partial [Archaeoglobaceae archaeon]
IVGVQIGIQVQKIILELLGETGTNLYVSAAFLIILPIVGGLCFRDVFLSRKYGIDDTEPGLAKKLEQKFKIPPMINFTTAKRTQSLWLTLPCGFLTGFLAATIAVGGFIGVPSMIYVIGAPGFVASGTELGVAFVMGSTGAWSWAYLLGAVDFRLTALVLATSLIGVQVGAVGTTYVKQYMVKLAMGVVMYLVVLSRACAVPGYLVSLGWITMDPGLVATFDSLVFPLMIFAMVAVTPIILVPMIRVRMTLSRLGVLSDALASVGRGGGAISKLLLFGAISAANYYLLFREPFAWVPFMTAVPQAELIMSVGLSTAVIALAIYWSTIYGSFAHHLLDMVNITSLKDEVARKLNAEGLEGIEDWASSEAGPGTSGPKPSDSETSK